MVAFRLRLGIESPFPSDWSSFPDNDHRITTRVDVSDWKYVRNEALRAHATQIDPNYAAAFNNLAVAYEHEGQLEKAGAAYERALKLDPNNIVVRQNFDLFKEIHDRTTQPQTP